jgi:hypothetical protein
VSAALVQMHFGGYLVFAQRLIKQDAVEWTNAAIVGGMY